MRKIYTAAFFTRIFFFIILLLGLYGRSYAQTTLTTGPFPPYTGTNSLGAGGQISFVIENTNAFPILLTGIGNYATTADNNSTWRLFYTATELSGPTTNCETGAWSLAATSGVTTVTTSGITAINFTGLSFLIPANTQYRFALENQGPGSIRYTGTGTTCPNLSPELNTFSGGGVNLKSGCAQIAGQNIGWSGSGSALDANSPRYFTGFITFEPAGPCTSPPNPGSATASPTTAVCTGSAVELSLTGNTGGTGQTYVWQSAATSGGPYTDISGSLNSILFTVNPTTTTWYRCAVTCSGNTQTSLPVEVVVNPAFPGGTYTINSALATGGTNFQSFTDAVASISCGITGPVVFNVEPGSGPYNEQISIPQIGGASSVNTITFNGNFNTIQATPTTTDRHIIRLNGADYVRFNKLSVLAVSGATFGWGIHLTNGANYNTIDSCIIDISAVTSTTVDNSGGIVGSGSTSDLNADGSASYNTFSNNTIIGAYQGIILNGATGALNSVRNIITNNIIRDFYAKGIELTDNDSCEVSLNDISRATRTAVTTFTGIELGIGNKNSMVKANRIHDTHNAATSQTGLAYGIHLTGCDAPAGSENKIFNNLVYNFNSGSGTQYGLANTGSDSVHFYHNTVVLDNASSTGGITRGFYQTTEARGIDIRNNIFFITRGGTGIKYCLYYNATTSTIISNNNVLYNAAPAGTNGIGTFGTTGYATLVDWQAVNSGAYDQNSISVDPAFAGPGSGDFYPNNSIIDNTGVAVGVTADIIGTPRDPLTPVPGAYEIVAAAGIDMGANSLLLPQQKNCFSSAETVTVTIRNYSASVHNFVTNPVTVNVSVSGTNPTIFTPVVINTGTLPANATLDVLISSNYNMTAAGTYTFNANTTVANDVNATNDAMLATDIVTAVLTSGTVSSNRNSYCVVADSPTLTLTGAGGGDIQWQSSLTGTAGSWTNVGTNNPEYIPASPITATTYYRAYLFCGNNSDTTNVVMVELNNPQVLTTAPGTRCGPGTVTLGATGSAGTTLYWYETASGSLPLGSGTSFTTPFITSTTTYYVSAASGAAIFGAGRPAPQSATNLTASPRGIQFNATQPVRLVSVKVFSTASTAGSGTVELRNSSGTLIAGPVSVNWAGGGTTTNPLPSEIILNFDIPVGTGHRLLMTSFSGGGISYEFTGISGTFPGYSSPNGEIELTASMTSATGTTTSSYYYFYDWELAVGCESARTAVMATIGDPPAFSVARDTVVCNNVITALTVETNLSNYDSYTWSPTTGLFTDAAATIPYTGGSASTLYMKSAVAGKYKYDINANNSSTACTAIDSVFVTVLPASVTIQATREQICVSGSSILSLPAGEYGDDLQWYSSADGVTYSPISGANAITYTTPNITATTYYKAEIKNSAGVICLQPTIMIAVGTPQILSTAPASRCGPGTVILGATAGPASATVNWYSSASGGLPVATGNSFTTPVLSSTTTYYASSIFGNTLLTAGRPAPASAVSLGNTPRGIQFNATKDVRLVSVKVFSTAAAAGSGTVELRNSSGTLIAGPVNVSWAGGGSTANPIPSELLLNFDVPVGVGHRLLMTSVSGGNITYETSGITGTWPNYSSSGGEIVLTASMTSLTGTSTSAYYYFYDWQISSGCESARTPVTATIDPGPAFSVAGDSVVCNNAITALSVESSLANFDSYTWSPTSGLFTDAAATIPYTGGNASTLYAKMATAGIHKYYIHAINNTTLCTGIDSVTLTVLPASVSLSATRTQICQSGSTTISLPPGDYGIGTIQWYTSPDGVAYSPIAGATGLLYNTPTLTAPTYYKAEIKNGAGNICLQPTITINVGIPEVVATAPAVRCDPGSVTLGATPGPAGATINWYATASGGQPIATGTSFVTPVLSATTTFYAASAFGFSIHTAGRSAPVSPTNLTASPRGIQFNATQPVKLESVTVFSTSADAGSGTIELRNSAGTVIAGPVNVNWGGGGTTASPVPYVLPLSIDVPVGNGHRLLMVTRTGGGIAYETSGISGTWPNYSSAGGEIELTASMTSATGTSTTAYYYFYDWKITTGCESPRVPVEATINGEITIDAAPVNQALCSDGQDVVFAVSASGAISNYQWRKNGVNIPGASASIYTVANASAADAGSYDVIVTGPCDTDTSSAALLIISSPTVITTDPVAQQACAGGSVTFHAAATGSGSLGYQWRKDGVDIAGAYGSSFTINNIAAADVGSYDVVVTGTCNKDTSNAAALVIGDATIVTTQPAGQVVCAGSTITFTAAGTGSGTLSYQWRKGGVNIAGANSPSFTISGVTVADAGNYDVLITGNCGTAISSVAGLVVNAATIITSQPVAQSSCLNSNVTFSVTATGSGTLTYQWRKGGVNISGATSSSLTLTNVTAADIASYDVVVTGTCGAVTSTSAGLTISAPGTWIGVLNADWNNAANWCGTVPTSSTDVFIPAFAPNMPVLSSTGFARNIVIENGASLNVIVNGILNLYGNISGNGTFTATAGNLVFRGTAPQSTPGFTATNVTMNGTGGFIPGGNITITGALTLTNGNITLGANNLRLSTGSTGSVNSHIITNGAGRVIVAGLAASSTRIIPIGISASSYTPVVLAANPGHTTDDLLVRVQEQVLANGTTGTRLTRFVVDRTWFIDEAVPGGSNVNITLQWNQGEELQDFGRNECYVMQYSGNTWVTGTESFAAGANPYTQTKSNVTSFSPFAVQTDPLPIVSAGIFPNPTSSVLNMVVRTNAPEQLTVSVFDLNGRLLKRRVQAVGFGGTLLSVDVIGLAAGTYIVKVSTPGNRELLVRKFVKVN